MPLSAFAELLSIGAAAFGDDIQLGKARDDARTIQIYIGLKRNADMSITQNQQKLKQQWTAVCRIFKECKFLPFHDSVSISKLARFPPQ